VKRAEIFTAAVIADTHIPDRVSNLHPGVISALQEQKVDIILHAGDICMPSVVAQLSRMAPVVAVAGNRDLFYRPTLPPARMMNLGGIPLVLMHGHGTWRRYLMEKLNHFLMGYRLEQFFPAILHVPAPTRVVIFGHSHIPENRLHGDLLLFNPGSAGFPVPGGPPTMGMLHIYEDGSVEGKILALNGAEIVDRQWVLTNNLKNT
jgi:putative phosphoesterase